jgi:hypothetical protein
MNAHRYCGEQKRDQHYRQSDHSISLEVNMYPTFSITNIKFIIDNYFYRPIVKQMMATDA